MKYLIVLPALLLAGCDTCPPKVEIVEVKIPVMYVPAPPNVEKPKLSSDNVAIDKDGFAAFVKSLESDLVRMNLYTKELENVISTYRDLNKQNPEVKKDGNSK